MLKDRIIVGFLSVEENKGYYDRYLENPTLDNKVELDRQFKKHFYMVRCLSYFLKMVHYESRHFDKKKREYNKRHQLTLDKCNKHGRPEIDFIPCLQARKNSSETLWDVIGNPKLYRACEKLTERQQDLLNNIFVKNMKDIEIAMFYGISQQAVTKAKKNALGKIRKELVKNA